MSATPNDRFEMRLPAQLKERVRQAADARGKSLTSFAIDALTDASNEVLDRASVATRPLGWAAGTAREFGDILAPASEPGEWDALRE